MLHWGWIILGVVVTAAVGVGIYFLVIHFTDKKPTAGVASEPEDPSDEPGQFKVTFVNTSDTALDVNRAEAPRYQAALESLEYYLLDINLYEDIEVKGTAWSPSADPTKQASFQVFSNGQDLSEEDYKNYGFTEAKADTTNYVNMVDVEDVATRLAYTATIDSSTNGKEMNYAVVSWMRPIRFKGTFNDIRGTAGTLYSKTASTSPDFTTEQGYSYTHQFSIMDAAMDQVGTQTTTIVLNNGGYFVRLAQPITLDITKAYRCLFAFNPEGVVKAANYEPIMAGQVPFTTNEPYGNLPGVAGDSKANAVHVPLLPLAPIVYTEGDTVFKETYTIAYEAVAQGITSPPMSEEELKAQNFNVRVEIYYLGSAPTKIAGATATLVLTTTSDMVTGGVQASFPGIFYQEVEGDLVHLRPYDKAYKLIHGLKRGVSGTCTLALFQGLGGYNVELAQQVLIDNVAYTFNEPVVQIV